MNNEHGVLIKGFKSQKQADEFIKWFDNVGEQYCDDWFGEHGYNVAIDVAKTYPLKRETVLDENHNEVDVTYGAIRIYGEEHYV